MRNPIALLLLVPALVIAPVLTAAAEEPTQSPSYSDQAVGKLKHGVSNALLGWTAIVREPIHAGTSGGNVFAGFGKGVWHAIGQTVGGVVQIVTFPLPHVDVPLLQAQPATADATPSP